MAKARNRGVRKGMDRGFTIMEMMVVLGLIAMVSVFVMPKLAKSFGKANITEAVSALQQISGQVEAICATRGKAPAVATVTSMISAIPAAYSALTVANGCSDYQVNLTPGIGSGAPKICIKRTATGWKYGFNTTGTDFTEDDLTVPQSRYDAGLQCQ